MAYEKMYNANDYLDCLFYVHKPPFPLRLRLNVERINEEALPLTILMILHTFTEMSIDASNTSK